MSSLTDVIDALGKSNSPAIFVAILGTIFFAVMKEYLRALTKIRELRAGNNPPTDGGDSIVDGGPEESVGDESSDSVVGFNFKLLEKYYEQHIVEYKLMARASLAIAILGFLIIMIGVFLVMSGLASAGVITSMAGLISEAAAALFFRQNKILMEQVKEYHKKLVSTQYLLTSITLANELPDGHAVTQRERIIGNLLFLSNELHGSDSNHLFPQASLER